LNLTVVALLVLLAGDFISAFGQSDRGTIRGTVTDPAGTVVPGARVVLTGNGNRRHTRNNHQRRRNLRFPRIASGRLLNQCRSARLSKINRRNFKVAGMTRIIIKRVSNEQFVNKNWILFTKLIREVYQAVA